MAEIGGMLAAGLLKVAAGKIAEAAGDRIMLQWRFGEDLEDMEDTMESIEAVLQDAEGQSIVNASVRLWLKRLSRASNDISDMFDEFEINKTRKSAFRKLRVLDPCLKLAPEVPMASKMKNVREKLENISNHHHKFSFMAGNNSNVQQVFDERATSSKVIKANILGRDEEKYEIISILMRDSTSLPDITILPIHGIGGMGKTTLAQMIFNDDHFKKYEKAWVYVSQTFDLKKIEDSVTSQLRTEDRQLSSTQETDTDPPAHKKILIVLDDLWEDNDLNLVSLKDSLETIGDGCKVYVIVTTRHAGVAQKIQTIKPHEIRKLSDDVCWGIIKQIVGFEDKDGAANTSLENIGKKIAEKCGGVALAARALGYTLRFRNYDGWISVNNSDIWNLSAFDNVLASLKLSYSSMPPYLRLCFSYCAVFEKDHEMAKDELIYQWAALGFIKPSDEFPIWHQGENCIKQLLEMSFLQHSTSPSFNGRHGKDVLLYTMHDLVHDLARSIMKDEILVDTSKKCTNFRGRNYRYAFLQDCSKPLNSLLTCPDKIRALRFVGSSEVAHCHAGLSTAKYLKVLDLGDCSLKKLPSSIGQLKLLRYLNARGLKDRMIPSSITKFRKLIYLGLCGSSAVSELPESIGEMKALMYLDLSGCLELKKLPKSFGGLESLIHLDLSDCPLVNNIPEALCRLTKLQYLNLSCRRDSELKLDLEGLSDVIGKLIELRHLNVSGCGLDLSEGDSDFLESISTLSNMEHLDLSSNNDIWTIPDNFCRLRKLHTLDLTGCFNLSELPGNMSSMDSLKFVFVAGCRKLDMSTLPINKRSISLPNFVVHTFEDEQSSKLVLLENVNPRELEISRLENVNSVKEAQTIQLKRKQSLVELTLDWTIGKKGFVEDNMELLSELVPPKSLKKFQLRGYNSVKFPEWLMCVHIYLPNLVRVQLKGLPQCTSLPPLGQLSNLEELYLEAMPSITKIDRGFCGDGMKVFPQLKKLAIVDMENLEDFSTTYSCDEVAADEFMFRLEELLIQKCHKLGLGPCPPRVKDSFVIRQSDSVLLKWGESTPHSVFSTCCTPLATLLVDSCRAPMHQWKLLHHLSGLKELYICNCNDLSSSPEITQVLVSLQTLYLENCSGVQELSQWLGNLTSLRSLSLYLCSGIQTLPERLGDLVCLKKLRFQECIDIMSFPESIQQLTNLESLIVRNCPYLRKWCELEENKKKIDHIKEKNISGFIPGY